MTRLREFLASDAWLVISVALSAAIGGVVGVALAIGMFPCVGGY